MLLVKLEEDPIGSLLQDNKYTMFLALLTLITALSISTVAIYYSVAGLAAIFASAVIPIIIMGVSLEVGKLITAVWLHKYWNRAAWWLKTYLSISVIVLMFITSMGIFGFLSKAHIEQTATAGDNSLQIEQLDNRISRQEKRITDADMVIGQLDEAVNTLIEYDRVRGPNGAIAVRESQKEERAQLNSVIENAQTQIATLQDKKLVLEKEQVAIEAEVGPIKYIAEFIYGEADKNILEEAVRWVIVVIIFVFDPLAILMLIASQYAFQYAREDRGIGNAITEEKDDESDSDGGSEDPDGDGPPDGKDRGSEESVPEEQTVDPEQVQKALDDWDVGTQKETQGLVEDLNADWYEENERIDIIGQNGNDGLHYQEIDQFTEEDPVSKEEKNQELKKIVNEYANVEQDTDLNNTSLEEESKKKVIESSGEFRLTEEQLDILDQDSSWSEAKKHWKEAHPDATLKEYKERYLRGEIDKLPWEEYLSIQEEKPSSYIMKKDDHQVTRTKPNLTEVIEPSGYIQNAEQQESSTLWKRIKDSDK